MRFNSKLPDEEVNVSTQHPALDALLLVLGIGATLVATIVLLALVIDFLVPFVPASVETNVLSYFETDDPGNDNTEPEVRQVQVQNLVDQLALGWEDNPYEFKVVMIDEPSPNAFALPGGYIGVTSGLLEGIASETELAFVLGHEIGHFKQRDHLRGLGRGLAIGFTLWVLNVGGAGGAFDLLSTAGGLTGRHFDRNQESDADTVGLHLVWRHYGHISGATGFFDQLPDPDGEVKARFQSYLSTHPVDSQRIETLNAMADERGWPRNRAAPAFVLAE